MPATSYQVTFRCNLNHSRPIDRYRKAAAMVVGIDLCSCPGVEENDPARRALLSSWSPAMPRRLPPSPGNENNADKNGKAEDKNEGKEKERIWIHGIKHWGRVRAIPRMLYMHPCRQSITITITITCAGGDAGQNATHLARSGDYVGAPTFAAGRLVCLPVGAVRLRRQNQRRPGAGACAPTAKKAREPRRGAWRTHTFRARVRGDIVLIAQHSEGKATRAQCATLLTDLFASE
eukprot:6207536-Pleurochrysis_carterae.AAC.4